MKNTNAALGGAQTEYSGMDCNNCGLPECPSCWPETRQQRPRRRKRITLNGRQKKCRGCAHFHRRLPVEGGLCERCKKREDNPRQDVTDDASETDQPLDE